MGSITVNVTTISNCDDQSAWSYSGTVSGQGDNTDTEREGNSAIQFESAGGHLLCKSPVTSTTFDLRDNEASLWFLNAYTNDAGALLLGTASDAVRLRVWSGVNWAEYYQTHLRLPDNKWPGGWMLLRASGGPGTQDRDSGTWGTAQVSAIDAIGLYLVTVASNTGTYDAPHGLDWAKYYDKIIISGYRTGTVAWEPQDIFDAFEIGKPYYGICQRVENFLRLFSGIDFGDGTVGAFKAENEFIYLNPSSSDHKYTVKVKDNFTLTLGEKNSATQGVYAQNGVQFVNESGALFKLASPVPCRPNFELESGSTFNMYASLLRGFGVISLGNGGSGTCDLIKDDFFDNSATDFDFTGLDALNVRLHFPDGQGGNLGTVYEIPNSFEGIECFQMTDGLTFRQTMDVTRYVAGDSSADLVVLEGKTVTLINSVIDTNKLKRVAT